MELEKSVEEDRIGPNVLELGTTVKSSSGVVVSRVRQSKGRSRRRSLPSSTSPQVEETGSFESHSSHPQQQQQQQIKNSRKMRRYNRKMSKRIRRVTQNAPNNNNEFLMEEHDHLYFLDQYHGGGTEEDSNSDEHHHSSVQQSHPATALLVPYSSSPEDEAEFLTRDFCNVYQGVHADRLYSMSKSQLIHEYQLMEERVEFLERKVSALSDPHHHDNRLDTSSDCELKSDSDSISVPMMLSSSAPSSNSTSSANTSLNDICHLSMQNDDDQGYYT